MAYEFVEAFSSVIPRIRVSQILAIVGVLIDLGWRVATRNLLNPSFADILAALLVGFYVGRRPSSTKQSELRKSRWIRLS